MNAAATIALVSAGLAVGVGLVARRLAHAPGSGEQRWFSVVAFSSAAYALCNLSTTLPASPLAVVWLSRLQIAALVVHLWGWVRYSQAFLGVAPGRLERLGASLLPFVAPLALVPGVVFSEIVADRAFAPLGVVYRQPTPTATGNAVFVALVVVGVAVAVRFARAWRAGVRHAGPLAAAFGALLAFSISDALATSLLLPVPYLLDAGFVAPVLAVASMMASRFVESTRALEALRERLVSDVESRTRELSSALESLHQAEKLAALGQFANGVAHEVNNPAAVVTASLRFVSDEARSSGASLSPETAEALADARVAMERITDLVRKLVDAGRIALAPSGSAFAEVSAAVEKVVGLQPEPLRLALRVDAGAARGALVRLRPDALVLVIESPRPERHRRDPRRARRVRRDRRGAARGHGPHHGRRRRLGDVAGGAAAGVRSVLHDQAGGARRGPGPAGGPRPRRGRRRRALARERARGRDPGDRRAPGARRPAGPGADAGELAPGSHSTTRSTRTRTTPRWVIPSLRAAASERSTTLPFAKGPRSLTVTTTERPFSRSVTLSRVPKGAVGCAQVRACWS